MNNPELLKDSIDMIKVLKEFEERLVKLEEVAHPQKELICKCCKEKEIE